MTLLASHPDGEIHTCDWRALAEIVRERGGCDAVIVDAPYSERTHAGHDSGAASANRVKANGVMDTGRERRGINYRNWSHDDVDAFVDTWSSLVRGWFVSLTDDVLFQAWRGAFKANNRQTFQDVPAIVSGMTVRLTGDGPSSWAIHCAVARPRTREMATWGTLPGGYCGAAESGGWNNDGPARGVGRSTPVVGGKPLWLMRALVRDYTRPGDLVVDPCGGGGTTALACRLEGRRFLTGDIMREHAEIAAERLSPLPTAAKGGTLALFGGSR